jgi:hypothetical protein
MFLKKNFLREIYSLVCAMRCSVLCLTGFFLLCSGLLFSQVKPLPGLVISSVALSCDLTEQGKAWYQPGVATGISIVSGGERKIHVQGLFLLGKAYSDYPNASFAEPYPQEINHFVQNSFFLLEAGPVYQTNLNPHFFLSLGVSAGILFFTPKNAENQSLADLTYTRFPDESFSRQTFVFTPNAGVGYRISPAISLNLCYALHLTGTDYLDNIGKAGIKAGKDKIQEFRLGLVFNPW